MKRGNKKSRIYTAWLALLTFTFTSFSSSPAVHAESAASASTAVYQNFSSLELPEALAKVETVFDGDEKAQRSVIVIQDAHSIPDAQRSIRKTILFLEKEYGARLIGVEGASGDLDTRIFQSYPEQEKLQEVFKDYMDKGEMTGSVAAAIFGLKKEMGARGVEFFGIEDWPVYEEGLALYLAAMGEEETILKSVGSQKSKVEEEKKAAYSPELLAVDQAEIGFQENSKDLLAYLKALAAIKAPEAGSEIALLLNDADKGQSNDAVLDAEVRRLAAKLKLNIGKLSIEGQKTFSEKFQAFQTSQISAAQFALALKDLSAKEGFKLPMSHGMAHQAFNQRRMRDLEGTKLFKDIEAYTEGIKESLFRNDIERQLDQRTHELILLTKWAKLELSREDWSEIRELWIVDSGSKETSVIPAEAGIQGSDSRVGKDDSLAAFKYNKAFYENAEKRDAAFIKNLEKRLKPGQTAVMIAGGFHAQGLAEHLQAKGIDYALVMPNIAKLPEESAYREHMKGNVDWENYFEVKNGKINLYEAFVRYTRDRLLGVGAIHESPVRDGEVNPRPTPQDPRLLKNWRDQIIRNLADEGKLAKAGEYTRFIDETLTNKKKKNLEARMQDVEKFIAGLKDLDAKGQFTAANIAKLLQPAQGSVSANKTATAQVFWSGPAGVTPTDGIVLQVVYEGVPLPTSLSPFIEAGEAVAAKSEVRQSSEQKLERVATSLIEAVEIFPANISGDKFNFNQIYDFLEWLKAEGHSIDGAGIRAQAEKVTKNDFFLSRAEAAAQVIRKIPQGQERNDFIDALKGRISNGTVWHFANTDSALIQSIKIDTATRSEVRVETLVPAELKLKLDADQFREHIQDVLSDGSIEKLSPDERAYVLGRFFESVKRHAMTTIKNDMGEKVYYWTSSQTAQSYKTPEEKIMDAAEGRLFFSYESAARKNFISDITGIPADTEKLQEFVEADKDGVQLKKLVQAVLKEWKKRALPDVYVRVGVLGNTADQKFVNLSPSRSQARLYALIAKVNPYVLAYVATTAAKYLFSGAGAALAALIVGLLPSLGLSGGGFGLLSLFTGLGLGFVALLAKVLVVDIFWAEMLKSKIKKQKDLSFFVNFYDNLYEDPIDNYITERFEGYQGLSAQQIAKNFNAQMDTMGTAFEAMIRRDPSVEDKDALVREYQGRLRALKVLAVDAFDSNRWYPQAGMQSKYMIAKIGELFKLIFENESDHSKPGEILAALEFTLLSEVANNGVARKNFVQTWSPGIVNRLKIGPEAYFRLKRINEELSQTSRDKVEADYIQRAYGGDVKLDRLKVEKARRSLTIADVVNIDKDHFQRYQAYVLQGAAKKFIESLQPLSIRILTTLRDGSAGLREKTEATRGLRWAVAWFPWLVARIMEGLAGFFLRVALEKPLLSQEADAKAKAQAIRNQEILKGLSLAPYYLSYDRGRDMLEKAENRNSLNELNGLGFLIRTYFRTRLQQNYIKASNLLENQNSEAAIQLNGLDAQNLSRLKTKLNAQALVALEERVFFGLEELKELEGQSFKAVYLTSDNVDSDQPQKIDPAHPNNGNRETYRAAVRNVVRLLQFQIEAVGYGKESDLGAQREIVKKQTAIASLILDRKALATLVFHTNDWITTGKGLQANQWIEAQVLRLSALGEIEALDREMKAAYRQLRRTVLGAESKLDDIKLGVRQRGDNDLKEMQFTVDKMKSEITILTDRANVLWENNDLAMTQEEDPLGHGVKYAQLRSATQDLLNNLENLQAKFSADLDVLRPKSEAASSSVTARARSEVRIYTQADAAGFVSAFETLKVSGGESAELVGNIVRAYHQFTREGVNVAADVWMRRFFEMVKAEAQKGSAGLSEAETVAMTIAIAESSDPSETPDFTSVAQSGKIIHDVASTGGVGNILPTLVSLLVNAADITGGLANVKIASDGRPGTIDTLEAIQGFDTALKGSAMVKTVTESGLAVARQTKGLAPVDKAMMALRRATGTMAVPALVTASILGKRISISKPGRVAPYVQVLVFSGATSKLAPQAAGLSDTDPSKRPRIEQETIVNTAFMSDVARRLQEHGYIQQFGAVVVDNDTPHSNSIGRGQFVQKIIQVLKGHEISREGDQYRGDPYALLAFDLAALSVVDLGLAESIQEARNRVYDGIQSGRALQQFSSVALAQSAEPEALAQIIQNPEALDIYPTQSITAGELFPEFFRSHPSGGYIALLNTAGIEAVFSAIQGKVKPNTSFDPNEPDSVRFYRSGIRFPANAEGIDILSGSFLANADTPVVQLNLSDGPAVSLDALRIFIGVTENSVRDGVGMTSLSPSENHPLVIRKFSGTAPATADKRSEVRAPSASDSGVYIDLGVEVGDARSVVVPNQKLQSAAALLRVLTHSDPKNGGIAATREEIELALHFFGSDYETGQMVNRPRAIVVTAVSDVLKKAGLLEEGSEFFDDLIKLFERPELADDLEKNKPGGAEAQNVKVDQPVKKSPRDADDNDVFLAEATAAAALLIKLINLDNTERPIVTREAIATVLGILDPDSSPASASPPHNPQLLQTVKGVLGKEGLGLLDAKSGRIKDPDLFNDLMDAFDLAKRANDLDANQRLPKVELPKITERLQDGEGGTAERKEPSLVPGAATLAQTGAGLRTSLSVSEFGEQYGQAAINFIAERVATDLISEMISKIEKRSPLPGGAIRIVERHTVVPKDINTPDIIFYSVRIESATGTALSEGAAVQNLRVEALSQAQTHALGLAPRSRISESPKGVPLSKGTSFFQDAPEGVSLKKYLERYGDANRKAYGKNPSSLQIELSVDFSRLIKIESAVVSDLGRLDASGSDGDVSLGHVFVKLKETLNAKGEVVDVKVEKVTLSKVHEETPGNFRKEGLSGFRKDFLSAAGLGAMPKDLLPSFRLPYLGGLFAGWGKRIANFIDFILEKLRLLLPSSPKIELRESVSPPAGSAKKREDLKGSSVTAPPVGGPKELVALVLAPPTPPAVPTMEDILSDPNRGGLLEAVIDQVLSEGYVPDELKLAISNINRRPNDSDDHSLTIVNASPSAAIRGAGENQNPLRQLETGRFPISDLTRAVRGWITKIRISNGDSWDVKTVQVYAAALKELVDQKENRGKSALSFNEAFDAAAKWLRIIETVLSRSDENSGRAADLKTGFPQKSTNDRTALNSFLSRIIPELKRDTATDSTGLLALLVGRLEALTAPAAAVKRSEVRQAGDAIANLFLSDALTAGQSAVLVDEIKTKLDVAYNQRGLTGARIEKIIRESIREWIQKYGGIALPAASRSTFTSAGVNLAIDIVFANIAKALKSRVAGQFGAEAAAAIELSFEDSGSRIDYLAKNAWRLRQAGYLERLTISGPTEQRGRFTEALYAAAGGKAAVAPSFLNSVNRLTGLNTGGRVVVRGDSPRQSLAGRFSVGQDERNTTDFSDPDNLRLEELVTAVQLAAAVLLGPLADELGATAEHNRIVAASLIKELLAVNKFKLVLPVGEGGIEPVGNDGVQAVRGVLASYITAIQQNAKAIRAAQEAA